MKKGQKSEVVGWKTAISRSSMSAPVKWLVKHGLIPRPGTGEKARVLDFGCGKGADAKALGYAEKYDPYWFPEKPQGQFDIVLCTYVLCVLPPQAREIVYGEIHSLLKDKNSMVFFSVRADLKKPEQPGKGCIQHDVILPSTIITTGGFRISMFSKDDLAKMCNDTSIAGFTPLTEHEYKRYFKYNEK